MHMDLRLGFSILLLFASVERTTSKGQVIHLYIERAGQSHTCHIASAVLASWTRLCFASPAMGTGLLAASNALPSCMHKQHAQ